MVFWPASVVLGRSTLVGRCLVERDPSVTPSTLSVQLAYQSNFFMLPSPEGDQHSCSPSVLSVVISYKLMKERTLVQGWLILLHNSGIPNTETLLLYSQVEHTAETKIAGFVHTVVEDLYKLFRCCASGCLWMEALAEIMRVHAVSLVCRDIFLFLQLFTRAGLLSSTSQEACFLLLGVRILLEKVDWDTSGDILCRYNLVWLSHYLK